MDTGTCFRQKPAKSPVSPRKTRGRPFRQLNVALLVVYLFICLLRALFIRSAAAAAFFNILTLLTSGGGLICRFRRMLAQFFSSLGADFAGASYLGLSVPGLSILLRPLED